MLKVIVGGLIKKDNKYLLIQEGKEVCRGLWNSPGGRLENGESIIEGAIREIKEECGLDVNVLGLLNVTHLVMDDNDRVIFNFLTEPINDDIKIDNEEIIDAKWFTYEEIKDNFMNLRRADILIPLLELANKDNINLLDVNSFNVIKN